MLRELRLAQYPCTVILSTSTRETQEVYQAFGLEAPNDANAYCQTLIMEGQGDFYFLHFNDYETALDDTILVHELIHLKNMILTSRGVQLDPANDEPEAYYFMYLFETIRDIIRHEDLPEVYHGEDDIQNFVKHPQT